MWRKYDFNSLSVKLNLFPRNTWSWKLTEWFASSPLARLRPSQQLWTVLPTLKDFAHAVFQLFVQCSMIWHYRVESYNRFSLALWNTTLAIVTTSASIIAFNFLNQDFWCQLHSVKLTIKTPYVSTRKKTRTDFLILHDNDYITQNFLTKSQLSAKF